MEEKCSWNCAALGHGLENVTNISRLSSNIPHVLLNRVLSTTSAPPLLLLLSRGLSSAADTCSIHGHLYFPPLKPLRQNFFGRIAKIRMDTSSGYDVGLSQFTNQQQQQRGYGGGLDRRLVLCGVSARSTAAPPPPPQAKPAMAQVEGGSGGVGAVSFVVDKPADIK